MIFSYETLENEAVFRSVMPIIVFFNVNEKIHKEYFPLTIILNYNCISLFNNKT